MIKSTLTSSSVIYMCSRWCAVGTASDLHRKQNGYGDAECTGEKEWIIHVGPLRERGSMGEIRVLLKASVSAPLALSMHVPETHWATVL